MVYSKYAYVVVPKQLTIYQIDFKDSSVFEICQFDDILESGTIYSLSTDCEDFMDFIDVSAFLNLITDASMLLLSDSLLKDILNSNSSFWSFAEADEALVGTDLAERISLEQLTAML